MPGDYEAQLAAFRSNLFLKASECLDGEINGDEFLELCERQKRGELHMVRIEITKECRYKISGSQIRGLLPHLASAKSREQQWQENQNR